MEEEVKKQAKIIAKRVAPIYELLGWKWATKGIPDVIDIYETIMSLYHDVNEGGYCETGGLGVRIVDGDVIIYMTIEEIAYGKN